METLKRKKNNKGLQAGKCVLIPYLHTIRRFGDRRRGLINQRIRLLSANTRVVEHKLINIVAYELHEKVGLIETTLQFT